MQFINLNILLKNKEICLDVLKTDWSPAWGLESICRAIFSLMGDPNANSPLNCDAGNMIRAGDQVAYMSVAKMYAIDFGYKSVPNTIINNWLNFN